MRTIGLIDEPKKPAASSTKPEAEKAKTPVTATKATAGKKTSKSKLDD